MESSYGEKLSFEGEWFQEEASIARKFHINFYLNDGAIEIFDAKSKKMFLRRTPIDSLTELDFYIGAKINIFGRQIDILDFGDPVTKQKLANLRKRTLIILKPDAIPNMGGILNILIKNNFNITNGKMIHMTSDDIKFFFAKDQHGDIKLPVLLNYFSSAPVIGFELIADDAIERLKTIAGPEDSSVAKEIAPSSLRAFYGQDNIKNAIHCSENNQQALRELQYFFDVKNSFRPTVVLNRSTFAIIKPHAIKEGKVGQIISDINKNGFKITALKMVVLDRAHAEEFYEVYKGVLAEYVQMVAQLSSGLCMAMELVAIEDEIDTHAEFRQLCGPMDPEVAVQIRPNTLRAKYGKNKVFNAIHCTDMPEDTSIEIEYFFKILF